MNKIILDLNGFFSLGNKSKYGGVPYHLNISKFCSTLNKTNINNMHSLYFLLLLLRVMSHNCVGKLRYVEDTGENCARTGSTVESLKFVGGPIFVDC